MLPVMHQVAKYPMSTGPFSTNVPSCLNKAVRNIYVNVTYVWTTERHHFNCLIKPAVVTYSMSEKVLLKSSFCPVCLSVCLSLYLDSGPAGETPQRLLRDTVKDASEKAKEAAKSLASAATVPQKPQQYVWRDGAWRTVQVTWTRHDAFWIVWIISTGMKISGISPIAVYSSFLSPLLSDFYLCPFSLSPLSTYCLFRNVQILTSSTFFNAVTTSGVNYFCVSPYVLFIYFILVRLFSWEMMKLFLNGMALSLSLISNSKDMLLCFRYWSQLKST